MHTEEEKGGGDFGASAVRNPRSEVDGGGEEERGSPADCSSEKVNKSGFSLGECGCAVDRAVGECLRQGSVNREFFFTFFAL